MFWVTRKIILKISPPFLTHSDLLSRARAKFLPLDLITPPGRRTYILGILGRGNPSQAYGKKVFYKLQNVLVLEGNLTSSDPWHPTARENKEKRHTLDLMNFREGRAWEYLEAQDWFRDENWGPHGLWRSPWTPSSIPGVGAVSRWESACLECMRLWA